jgi:hypothetical protein
MRTMIGRRNLPLVASLLLAWSPLAAQEAPVARPLQGDLTHGKALYDAHCMKCHGMNGMGGAKDNAPRLSDSSLLNAVTDAKLLDLMREGDSKRPKKQRHFKVPADVGLLDLWDVVGFLRSRTVEVLGLFPDADRYLAGPYQPDEFALERLEKTTGKRFSPEESRLNVFTAYKTGWGSPAVLLPNDPKILDKLKRNMKVGYVVAVALPDQPRATEVVLALEVKNLSITQVRALGQDGSPNPDLDKQLQKFVGKGDRRLSGQPKATLKVGGGGKAFQALEVQLTESFVRATEAVTAFEVKERDRSWADDDF